MGALPNVSGWTQKRQVTLTGERTKEQVEEGILTVFLKCDIYFLGLVEIEIQDTS